MVNDSADGEDCPICFHIIEHSDGIVTPCGHNFCSFCLIKSLDIQSKCPYCRQDVAVLKLRNFQGEPVTSVTCKCIISARISTKSKILFLSCRTLIGSWKCYNVPNVFLLSLLLVYSAPYNQTYIQGGTVGLASYHFTDAGVYISYENRHPTWLLSNGLAPPSKKYFEKIIYDSETRKFEGLILWDPEATLEPGVVLWKYNFTFSSDYQTIESGTVSHVDCDDGVVKTSLFGELGGLKYQLDTKPILTAVLTRSFNSRNICFVCGDTPVDPCKTSCDHTVCRLCLLTNISQSDNGWKCTICNTKVFLSQTVNATTQTPLSDQLKSPFGNVYVQDNPSGRSVGYASYHFCETLGVSHISYQTAPSHWTLADGTMVPQQKCFEALSYDTSTRTLTAEINWEENAFYGDTIWKYKITFSIDFLTIDSGQVQSFDDEGVLTSTTQFSAKSSASDLSYSLYEENIALELLQH